MSWKTEVIADNSGKWCGNGLRFATEKAATEYVNDLALRWTAVRETRVVQSDEPVTEFEGGMKVRVRSGKLYVLSYATKDGKGARWDHDHKRIKATQWQVNDKHPQGRYYGPRRYLDANQIEVVNE
jgi:hypothetical protein